MSNFMDIIVGEKLVITSGGWSTSVYIGTVERLTKTQIITERGERFRRSDGYRVGGGDYSHSYISKKATQEDIDEIRRKRRLSNQLSKLFSLTNVNTTTLKSNIEDIIKVSTDIKSLMEEI